MNANHIAVIADSTCDIPSDLISTYEIGIVPHYVIWGDHEYRDRIDLQPKDFYERLETDHQRPTTAQATEADFTEAYLQALARGALEIVVLTVSSAMSGAYQMALNAARSFQIPVHVVDSKGPTMSLGWQTLAAARLAEAGGDIQAILKKVDLIRQSLTQIVGMNTMEYLKTGGRIGGAAIWLGAHLQIKPVVSINHTTGLVEPEGIARTHGNMMELVFRKFIERMGGKNPERIAVLHGNCEEDAAMMMERVKSEFSPLEVLTNITGPVLGINTGPRAIALCGYAE